MPLFHAKIGRWQTASIPGRGINDARKAIRKWVRERDSRVFVKPDVVKCYPSIDRAVLKTMLAHDVGDRRLLRLVFTLVDQYRGDRGLNIGSYLSQWLANYYLSAAWLTPRDLSPPSDEAAGGKARRYGAVSSPTCCSMPTTYCSSAGRNAT